MSAIFSQWFMEFGIIFLGIVIALMGYLEVTTREPGYLTRTYSNTIIAFAALTIALNARPPRMTDQEWTLMSYVGDVIFLNILFFLAGIFILDVFQRSTKVVLREHVGYTLTFLFGFSFIFAYIFTPAYPL